MKKILTLFAAAIMLLSCGTYLEMENPEVAFNAGQVLYETHPELVPYYEANVLNITSLKELPSATGDPVYEIRYRFVQYELKDYQERIDCLKEHFPELYQMYITGIINVRHIYRYVDENGQIRHRVKYGRVYDFYYEYVPLFRGYHYNYRARMTPPPPPPRPQGGPRPGNGPRPGGGRPRR